MSMTQRQQTIFGAISDLDSAYVQQCVAPKPRRRIWQRVATVAAALALVMATLWGSGLLTGQEQSGFRGCLVIRVLAESGEYEQLDSFKSVPNGYPQQNMFGVDQPCFSFDVWATEEHNPNFHSQYELEVCYDGIVYQWEKDSPVAITFLYSTVSDSVGYGVVGWCTDTMELELRLKDRQTGEVVTTCKLHVKYLPQQQTYELTLQ